MVRENQVALVTGASQGAGAAAARELALRGHRVIAAMRTPSAMDQRSSRISRIRSSRRAVMSPIAPQCRPPSRPEQSGSEA